MELTRTSQVENTTIQLGDIEFIIHAKFDSKKNQVYLVTDTLGADSNKVVLKIYNEEFKKNAKLELNTINKLNKLNISTPKIIKHSNDWVILEFIPGRSILQIIDSEKREIEPKELIRYLAEWFANLHAKTLEYVPEPQVLLKGDCVLKNFIYVHDSKQLFGVDFEESTMGKPLIDVGAVCSAILTIKPMFSGSNFKLCRVFIGSYMSQISKYITKNSINSTNIIDQLTECSIAVYTASALESAASWMSKDNSEIALNWSKNIKNKRSLNLL